MQVTDELDPRLRDAVELARAAAAQEAADAGQDVGEYVTVRREEEVSAIHYFRTPHPGYVGWFVWVALIYFTGVNHPVPLNDISDLGVGRKLLGIFALIAGLLLSGIYAFRLETGEAGRRWSPGRVDRQVLWTSCAVGLLFATFLLAYHQ